MTTRRYELVFFGPKSQLLTLEALAESAGLHPAVVQRFVDCGLIDPSAREGTRLFFDAEAAPRLRTIARLRDHLGINLAGIAVILEMRERLAALQREIEKQRARL
jgi:MerR family transcriptional regulator/heat shock protein HspR